jgi:hypothetical protein
MTHAITALVALPALAIFVRYWFWPTPLPGIPHNEVKSFWGDMLVLGETTRRTNSSVAGYFEPMARKFGPIYQACYLYFRSADVSTPWILADDRALHAHGYCL